MSPLAVLGLIGATGLVGWVGYDVYKAASAPTGLQKIVDDTKADAKKALALAQRTVGAAGSTAHHDLSTVYNDLASLF